MSKTWWRVAAINHQTQAVRTIAFVNTEYAAKRMCRYAAAWLKLTEEECLECWPIELDLTDPTI